ncbi:MAG: holo-[acyl-carrier-protein] synthase [candidate division Zixibacteria bacterium RBG_16_53_22]|nr:MAG: holo-[acyl-carrier-protein] synthase [candidate division Zixibacteria bacterium RBG_16_53_22]
MIVGIGCDILDISRVKRQLGADDGFTAQIFTSEEIAYCRGKRYPERHFAARFAAKEAFFKAVSDGARVDISWHDVEVTNEASGKPVITLSGKAAELAGARGVRNVFMSLSHTDHWAMANVVLES